MNFLPQRGPKQLELFDTEVGSEFVAKVLRTSRQSVMKLVQAGTLEAYRLHETGVWRISYASVVDYINGLRAKYLGDDPPGPTNPKITPNS